MENVAQLSVSIAREFEKAEFGDKRLTKRVQLVASEISKQPDRSFPQVFDDAGLEGTYRMFNNDKVTPEAILAPHISQTAKRTAQYTEVLVAHDTSVFNFGTKEREGLGPVGGGKSCGFLGHISLAIAPDETREVLGVVAAQTIVRKKRKKARKKKQSGKKQTRGNKRSHKELQRAADNESRRWLQGVKEAEQNLADNTSAIHVKDREGDSYALMAALHQRSSRFVIRIAHDRRVYDSPTEELCANDKIRDVLKRARVLGQREIYVSQRDASPLPAARKHHPPRSARKVTVSIRASRVTVKRSASASECPLKELTLNVVQVFEENPPKGMPAVEWVLWTTEPIETAEQVWRIVDIYRARWLIEEFFKALKTGCAYEKRQLESARALFRAFSVFLPIAWQLLRLRTLCRHDETAPAEKALTPLQLTSLRGALNERNVELPPCPTVRDALLGIAKLGGHRKQNGEPGWIVLGRGLEKLLLVTQGYRLAMEMMASVPYGEVVHNAEM